MKRRRARTQPSAQEVLDGLCMDCGVDTIARGEYYSLRDAIWRAVNPLVIGHLCLECAEDRLGRGLHRGDFSSAPLNKTAARKCAALAQRLQRSRPSPRRNASRRPVWRKNVGLRKRTQSTLGRLSAALLSYRGPDGRVPPETMMSVLRTLTQQTAPAGSLRKSGSTDVSKSHR